MLLIYCQLVYDSIFAYGLAQAAWFNLFTGADPLMHHLHVAQSWYKTGLRYTECCRQ